MTDMEIKRLAKEAALEAIKEIMYQNTDKRLHNTRLLMRNYNNLKEHIKSKEDKVEIIVNIDDEINLKSDYVWLESVVRSKTRTAKMMKYVDDKIKYLENKYKEKQEYEKFRAFELKFIEEKTNEEIRGELNCGINMPKRWTDIIIKELSILLWGIDAIGI